MGDLWEPLWLSLRVAASATLLVSGIAIPLAYFLSRRRFVGKSLIEAGLTIPLVLPPTVVGYLIIIALGSQGWPGRWLRREFGYSILFRFEGAVLAAAAVALPLVYLPAKAAFATVERDFEDNARVLGANRAQVFWHVSLPLARRGLLSGVVLAFARALGEFGATIMVYGNQPGRVTLPVSIYIDYLDDHLENATAAVIALSGVSLALILAYNASASTRQE